MSTPTAEPPEHAWRWMDARHPHWKEALPRMHAWMVRTGIGKRVRLETAYLVLDDVYHVVCNAPGCAIVGRA